MSPAAFARCDSLPTSQMRVRHESAPPPPGLLPLAAHRCRLLHLVGHSLRSTTSLSAATSLAATSATASAASTLGDRLDSGIQRENDEWQSKVSILIVLLGNKQRSERAVPSAGLHYLFYLMRVTLTGQVGNLSSPRTRSTIAM